MIIGHHVSITDLSIDKIIYECVSDCRNCRRCMQIFTRPKVKYERSTSSLLNNLDSLERASKLAKESGFLTYIHEPYVYNFTKSNRVIHSNVTEDLIIANKLSSNKQSRKGGIVIHLGSNTNNYSFDTMMENINNHFKRIIDDTEDKDNSAMRNVSILIENQARHKESRGSKITARIGELSDVYNEIDSGIKKYIGVCFDTCHAFVSGYSFKSINRVNRLLERLDNEIGLNNIHLIHYNDAASTKMDIHADILFGHIPSEPLLHFAKLSAMNNIPIVLETNQKNTSFSTQIDIIKSYVDGKLTDKMINKYINAGKK